MVRRVGVLAAMVLVIAALAWAGVANLRARRNAANAAHVELRPAKADNGSLPEVQGGELRGKPAPSFTLVSTDGKKVSLSDFKGHPVIVNFWATWCGPCKLEMPWFEEFRKRYAAQGLVVLGLNQDDGMAPAEVEQTARKIGVSYPVLMPDKESIVSKAYGGVDYLPETFYVDKAGKVAAISAGAPSKDQMEGLIELALNGK
jgi:thiol-disulfide isomerase/thioredoxin